MPRRRASAIPFAGHWLRLLLPVALGLPIASCAHGVAEPPAVVLWAMGSEAEVADAVIDGFRTLHPDIPVRVQRVPWSAAHEKLLTAFVGNSMPDVFQLGNTWIPELATLGALEPLDERVASSNSVTRDDFFPGALDPNVVGGRLLALPWYVDTRILFYRRDLLAAAGVAEAPRTWQQWKAALSRLRNAGEAGGKRFGIFLPVDEWQTPVILALQQGASLLRDDDSRGNLRSPEVRRALEFYLGLFADDLAPKKSEAQIANLYREFAAGYFAFFVTGPWNLAELARRMPAELADAWTTAPMPSPLETGDGSPGVSIAGGASLAVSATSVRKDAAWELVEYLSQARVQADFHARSGDLPSRRSAWEDPAFGGDERVKAFRVQLDHLVATPKIPEWERIASKITLHLERIVRGEIDLDAGLAGLDEDVDAILAKRREMLAAGEPRGAATGGRP